VDNLLQLVQGMLKKYYHDRFKFQNFPWVLDPGVLQLELVPGELRFGLAHGELYVDDY